MTGVVDHLVAGAVAAGVVASLTPLTRWLSFRVGAVDHPGPRRVHHRPTARLGGLAILLGVLAALAVASQLDSFSQVFSATSEPLAVGLAAVAVVAVGVIDDVFGLRAPAKLAGQVMAAGVLVLFGVVLRFVYIPGDPGTIVALTPELAGLVTIGAIVVMINAVNLTDGLDGLAAGMVAIAAAALLWWTAVAETTRLDIPTIAPLLLSVIVGACLGFLVHNRPPASVFMGDTGALLLGLLLATAGISALGPVVAPTRSDFAAVSVPVLVPALVLAVPLADTVWAIARRLGSGSGVFAPDKRHLHHRLLAIGHSPRGTLAIMYGGSAVLAFGAVAISVLPTALVAAVVATGLLPIAGAVVWRWRRNGDVVDGSSDAGQASASPPEPGRREGL